MTQISEDAQGLGPSGVACGVYDITGDGGVEVSFVPTKNEVLQLARYWATEIITLDFYFFLYGQTGSEEWRTYLFAERRLNRISQLVGEEEVRNAFKDAEETFGKARLPQDWKVFKEGSEEEQRLYRDKVWEEIDENLAKKAQQKES
jgi:hypothetical protein